MPDPKRPLEFLIRRRTRGGSPSGIEFRQLDSGRALLALRPRRVEGVLVEENAIADASGGFHVVRSAERYVKLDAHEYFLWQHLDGQHTVQDLALAYFLRFGSFDFAVIARFLNKLRKLGLIVVARTRVVRARAAVAGGLLDRVRRFTAGVDLRWEGAGHLFQRLHRVLGWLYTRAAAVPLALVAIVGLVVHATGRGHVPLPLPTEAVLVFAPLFAGVFLLLHELSHGLACVAAGRRAGALGFTFLDRLLPVLYVDVTDMWMATRRARVAVALAGPAMNLVLAGGFALGAQLAPGSVAAGLARLAADVNLAIAAWTAWPFLGAAVDGYQALADALGIVRLRAQAFALLGRLVGRPTPPLTAPRAPLVLYLGATAASFVALVVFVAAFV